jgi:hypothetical protein
MEHIGWFVIGIIILVIAIDIYKRARKEGKDSYKEPPQGTIITYPDPEEIDEHSPENLDFDKVIKRASLRRKLDKIEKEKEL